MSLSSVEPSHAVADVQPLPIVVACGPEAQGLSRKIAAGDRRGRVGVMSFADADDSAVAADAGVADSLVRHALPLRADGTIERSEIRRQIAEIARRRAVTLLVIECDPATDPVALVSVLSDAEYGDELPQLAQLGTVIMGVDATILVDALVRQRPVGGWSAAALAEQVERADAVVLENSLDASDRSTAAAIVSALNPLARISANEDVLATNLIDQPSSTRHQLTGDAAWRAVMDGEPVQTFAEGLTSLSYRARRPFHPERFWEFLRSELAGIVRAKGFFWLATHMDLVGGLNVAGAERQVSPVGEWWAAVADPAAQGSTRPEPVRNHWVEPFGDRRQELSFLGVELDAARLRDGLNGCLLSDSEMAAGPDTWRAMADPFSKWSHAHHEHQCAHGCCHEHPADEHCHHEERCCCHDHE